MIALALALTVAANPFLEQAKEEYVALDFESCVQRLGQAAEWKGSTPAELRDVELYAGLCHLNLSHRREAAEHFKLALRIDESADLPPYSSPKAVELFLAVKKSLREPAKPLPDDDSPFDTELTPKPKVDPLPPAPPAVWKKNAGPIALGVVAVAAIAAGIGLGLHAKALESQANVAHFESDAVAYGRAAQDNAVAANVAYGVGVVAGATGLIIYLTSK